ncbi:hypothetical protein BU25DRAFT_189882 [Macroventuria anomochaeta]|uniref:Uncharacterized protein n=1 Tax=Macroventuria anomochaeta TaxID=301207 RepID=A0ACB6SBW9_9PLEO|nr:uncharacterized protein BU25DRAFT_189882 [Macroventuria anomochaeta]KAF2631503.1 hypothetical protein BU25DRAFT_189882 [Macroventuria anomochaeta]
MHRYSRIDSIASTATTVSDQEILEYPALVEYYLSILPRVLLTSDLGTWKHRYQLRFLCITANGSPLALFTTSDWACRIRWVDGKLRHPSLLKARCPWRNGLPRIRSPCTVRATIRNKWQYKICRKAIIRWDAELGTLLVDYKKLLADYEAQEKSNRNRRRVASTVKKYHQLEGKVLTNETGENWANWGDWDIFPASADVAQVCRLEGRDFEEGLGKMPGRSKKYRLRRCLKDMTKAVKRMVLK